MKSIQAEDKGIHLCEFSSPEDVRLSHSINVTVLGKRSEKYLYLDVLNHQSR